METTGEEGWINSEYARPITPAPPENSPILHALTSSWKPMLFLVAAVLLLSYLMRKLPPKERPEQPLTLILTSLAVGFVFLFNQFGPLFSRLLAPRVDITALSPLWTINTFGSLSYPRVLLIITLLAVAIGAVAPGEKGGRGSFIQGVSTGFLLLPILTLALTLTALVVWLLIKILSFIAYILKLVLIPFTWIFEHAILPVLRFLAKPFVWLWENILSDFVLWIATPFVWLWKVVLTPALGFVLKYILRPLIALGLGIITAMLCLLPIAVVGLALLETARASIKGSLGPFGLFSQGMTIGFLLFDASLLSLLNYLGTQVSTPPVTLLVMLALPTIAMLRLLITRKVGEEDEEGQSLRDKFFWYCKTSKVELISTCILFPVLLVMQILAGGED